MPTLRHLSLATLLFFCHPAMSDAPKAVVFEAIPNPQAWVGRVPKMQATQGDVTFLPTKGTDFYISVDGKTKTLTAPVLLFKPAEEFTLSAKITISPEAQYNGGALMIYSDADNWVKYLYEVQSEDQLGVVMDVVSKGSSDIAYYEQSSVQPVYLALVRADGQLFFHHSRDGRHWKLNRVLPAGRFADAQIGFEAQAPMSETAAISVSEVDYRESAPDNPWFLSSGQK